MKPKAQEREADRPTEDDIAQVSLGGTRGSADLACENDAAAKAGYASGWRLLSWTYRIDLYRRDIGSPTRRPLPHRVCRVCSSHARIADSGWRLPPSRPRATQTAPNRTIFEDLTHTCVQCGATLIRTIRPLTGDAHELLKGSFKLIRGICSEGSDHG